MTMTRRTAPDKKKKEAVVEVPETTLCVVTETTKIPKWVPTLGMCVECNLFAAHSAVDSLCYGCHKTKAGFIFDVEKNRFVKVTGGKR